jgi:hypothetical protein
MAYNSNKSLFDMEQQGAEGEKAPYSKEGTRPGTISGEQDRAFCSQPLETRVKVTQTGRLHIIKAVNMDLA